MFDGVDTEVDAEHTQFVFLETLVANAFETAILSCLLPCDIRTEQLQMLINFLKFFL
jgi:hypothetical protein